MQNLLVLQSSKELQLKTSQVDALIKRCDGLAWASGHMETANQLKDLSAEMTRWR